MQSPVIDVVVSDTPPEDRDAVLAVLRTYNQAQTGRVRAADFAVLLRDPETEAVIGGLYGEESYGWGFIKYLVVPENLRGLGLGSRLMKEAEEIARRRGFVGVWLDTYDFQARPFYEKLGYEVFGELEGCHGARGQFFLKKRFS
ncbi:MAG: GNAT family N-acetyltransferase [Rhizobiaceae bacterium]|nr:GNAT family N-acetyltransferase [Rhizobiaceae bacterium]